MTAVWASTDQLPSLASDLADRRAQGLDTFDEWWGGVYRVVTGPSPKHGRFLLRLGIFIVPLADRLGFDYSAPANIGIDKVECRVPDLVVFRPDTPLTSAAFLSTAELVVEVLSPGEEAGAKLDFFARWQVGEYLGIDLCGRPARLLRRRGDRWIAVDTSAVLGFSVEPGALVAGDARLDLPAGES